MSAKTNWPGDDKVMALAVPLIKKFERFSATPYLDVAGVPTIGYGTTVYPDGRRVTMQDAPVTEMLACGYLEAKLTTVAPHLGAMLLRRMPTAHEAAAMLSLAYNIGLAAFASSNVLKQFNIGNITFAANSFSMWDKAHVDGKLVTVPGLDNRREQEREFFLMPDA